MFIHIYRVVVKENRDFLFLNLMRADVNSRKGNMSDGWIFKLNLYGRW